MWRLPFQFVIFSFVIWFVIHLTESSDELALMQKRDCEIDLKGMGCTGISSTCEFVGSIATCTCHASKCSKIEKSDDYVHVSENGPVTNEIGDFPSPNAKVGKVNKRFSFRRSFFNFLETLNREFRLRYGIEGIGTKNGFLRLGFCKIPQELKRNDVCFFMHWFFENGFKQLNVRFGHRVTNSSSASV